MRTLARWYSAVGFIIVACLMYALQPLRQIYTASRIHITLIPDMGTQTAKSVSAPMGNDNSYVLPPTSNNSKAVVMGRVVDEDMSWVRRDYPDWRRDMPIMDEEDCIEPVTQGSEARTYLSYLVDNYNQLPAIIVFLRPHRNYDSFNMVTKLRQLRMDNIHSVGYVNLKCNHRPGCPADIQPYRQSRLRHVEHEETYSIPQEDPRKAERILPDAWRELFSNTEAPRNIGVARGAQFAVTRDQVFKRPLSDYQHFLDWVIHAPHDDDVISVLFEYLWHIIFGQRAVHCPVDPLCICNTYGTGCH